MSIYDRYEDSDDFEINDGTMKSPEQEQQEREDAMTDDRYDESHPCYKDFDDE